MKKYLILIVSSLFVLGTNLMAQTLSVNDFPYSSEGRSFTTQTTNERSSIVDCSKTWLIIPALASDPTKKQDIPLGDVKPILEKYINNNQKFGSFYIGKATECQTTCTPQISAYGEPQGLNYGAFMDGGNYQSYKIERPGKYIIIAQSIPGKCYLAETFFVSGCVGKLKDTVKVVEMRIDTIKITNTITKHDTIIDKNSVAILQLDVCESLALQLKSTAISDLSNISLDLKIAPNPVSEMITLLLTEEEQFLFEKIEIFSLSGSFIKETTHKSLSIVELPKASYIARINFAKGLKINVKFIKI